MPAPALELADIFRQHGPAYRQAHSLPLHQHKLMRAIETCRTPVMGASVEWCDHCQYTRNSSDPRKKSWTIKVDCGKLILGAADQ